MHQTLAAVFLALALAACDAAPPAPAPNATASHAVRIHGLADPSLTVQVTTQYLTSAEACRQKTGPGGALAPRSDWIASPVTRSGSSYEATVLLDHFQADECGWYPFVIAFELANGAGLRTGHFARTAAGTSHVPGPEGKIWISTALSPAAPDGSRRTGSGYVRPLDLQCTVQSIRGAKGLSCVPNSPRELPLISESAQEVEVNFRDFSASPVEAAGASPTPRPGRAGT